MTGNDVAARVAAQFVPGGAVDSVRAFGDGNINDTYLVIPRGADYIVQRINRAVFNDPERLVDNVVAVSEHLGGRFVPELIPAPGGGRLVYERDDAWRAWKRVDRAESLADATPAQAESAANLLGRFHAGLADLRADAVFETLPDFHDPTRRLGLLHDVVAIDPCGRAAGVAAEIAAAFAGEPLAAIADDLVARVPRRVAHNDAKLDNVLFRGGEAVCLVDLDTVMPSAWFWDVGDLLRTASTHTSEDDPRPGSCVVDRELYGPILDGYRAGVATNASDAEDEALARAGAIVTYEQALRFLTDWIAGDVYYRVSRPEQNLDRARAQLGLLASMPGTVAR